jgi:hypothetical protein
VPSYQFRLVYRWPRAGRHDVLHREHSPAFGATGSASPSSAEIMR